MGHDRMGEDKAVFLMEKLARSSVGFYGTGQDWMGQGWIEGTGPDWMKQDRIGWDRTGLDGTGLD